MGRKLPIALAALGLLALCALAAHAQVVEEADLAEVDAEFETGIGRGLLNAKRRCKHSDKCGRNCCKKHERCAWAKDGPKCVKDCKREKYECGYKCCKHGEKCYEFGRYHGAKKECVDKYFCKNDWDCADLYGEYTCNEYKRQCVRKCDNDYDCGRWQYCDSHKNYCVHKCHDDYDCWGDQTCDNYKCVNPWDKAPLEAVAKP